ncbi:hypothetical protein [Aliikangiella sp. IMCC44359]|uniref:hypothetical protein n=1 Tax=Aliikangiella sp. IMCC44359 TaxID=3459125 RepID=UPI00403A9F52
MNIDLIINIAMGLAGGFLLIQLIIFLVERVIGQSVDVADEADDPEPSDPSTLIPKP